MRIVALRKFNDYAPISLAYLAPLFRREGHEYSIGIYKTSEDLVQYIGQEVDCVCLSAMVTDFDFVYEVAKWFRQHFPEVPIVLGGRISVAPLHLLEKLGVDFLVYGDADPTLVQVLDLLQGNEGSFEDIPGIVIFKQGESPFTTKRKHSKPLKGFYPYWDDFDMKKYDHERNPAGYPVITGMGCVGNCTYCSSGMRGVRFRPVEEVIDEMVKASQAYDLDVFFMETEIFYYKEKDIRLFCEKYKESGLDKPWHCSLRADFNSDFLPLLKDAGCESVCFGMESYDDNSLKSMGKGVQTHQIDAVVDKAKSCGMEVTVNLMAGNLGDTTEAIEKSVSYVIDSGVICRGISSLFIYPGTKVYEVAIQRGYIKNENQYCMDFSTNGGTVSIFDENYPNVSEMTTSELRRVHNAEQMRLHHYTHKNFAAVETDLITGKYTCRKCG